MSGISGLLGGGVIGKLISGLAHRGPDGFGLVDENGEMIYGDYDKLDIKERGVLGHNLLKITKETKQPISKYNSILVFDGRIYNTKQLKAKSGAEAVLNVLRKYGIDGLSKLDGSYAFAYIPKLDKGEIIIGRDVLGIKPLWISTVGKPKFASEAKVLPGETWPVLSGEILTLSTKGIIKRERRSLKRIKADKKDYTMLKKKIEKSVRKMTKDVKEVALLFSGGVDSTLLYVLMSKHVKVHAYTTGFPDAQDIGWAKRVADELGIDLKTIELDLHMVEALLPELVKQLETTNVMKIGVAFPFYVASKLAKEDGNNVIFSGLGTEELFAGYERHVEAYRQGGWEGLNRSMWEGLENMWERDLYRDDLATMAHSIELRTPFLDMDVIMEAMSIHPKLKMGDEKKEVLRKIAKEEGVPTYVARRPKKAAQYGSGVDKAIRKLAKRKGMKPQAYLEKMSRLS